MRGYHVLISDGDVSAYIAEVEDPGFIDFCTREALVGRELIDIGRGEIAIGLDILLGHELAGKRILEVGAGIGLLSIFLRRRGYDVTALDPSLGGFEAHARLGLAARKRLGANDLPFLLLRRQS